MGRGNEELMGVQCGKKLEEGVRGKVVDLCVNSRKWGEREINLWRK